MADSRPPVFINLGACLVREDDLDYIDLWDDDEVETPRSFWRPWHRPTPTTLLSVGVGVYLRSGRSMFFRDREAESVRIAVAALAKTK